MTQPPKAVRLATPADDDAIYRLLLGLERDNGIGYPHDPETVRQRIARGTAHKSGMIGVIDAPDGSGELAGSVSLEWGEFWYNRHIPYMVEQWLFVHPDWRRGTGYGDQLMQWVRWIRERLEESAGREVPFFTSVTSRHRLKAKMRWWGRRGEQVGAIYLLRGS